MKHLFLLALCLSIFFVSGCGNLNRVPRYHMEDPMNPVSFKRFQTYDSQDFVHNFKKEAYSPVNKPLTKRLSETQLDVLARHGQPNYTRKGFRSLTGETVDEWAYWDRQVIVQFVQRELVYEGPLTDMDSYRIRYGYPAKAWVQSYETGVKRDLWDYRGIMVDTHGMIVTFTNEKMITENRY